ncbi:hypothetical protein [Campylobacter suis]|uniref:DUF4231 domain-containing protein n=1 Tax=Campylobacter suis TaxID=2790657 RepID=A0ABM8Q2X9_9BACT|nr:hypothetical protein [Campylobacter suis]CAD7287193.1 hypothetical protein LMG8286_00824 [Campylobacter suis]
MCIKFKKLILDRIFIVSRQPVLFRDLLEANSLYNEGMLIDCAKLNFRFDTLKTYGIYTVICTLILFISLLITHSFLAKIDSHISIIGTMVITSLIFLGFDMFKIWARKEKSAELIKQAWTVHFPFFAYEKYSKKVDEIYTQAVKDGITKSDLEQHVLEKLVSERSE